MISNNEIKGVIEACKDAGFENIGLRDVAYAWLACFAFNDAMLAYKAIYGRDEDFDMERGRNYGESAHMRYLKQVLETSYGKKQTKKKVEEETEDMTFEMNKQGIIKLIKETEEAMQNKQIEKKDGLKILADLRVKLNDKFNVQEEVVEQMVVVEKKFNHICKYGYECYLPTKDDLMAMYDLVPRKKEETNKEDNKR